MKSVRVVLVSTYELGHQPFGLASPAAWLSAEGADVACIDLAVQTLDEDAVTGADLVALYVPMHTATRLAAQVIPRLRALNPSALICAYGLYASVNDGYLRGLGADHIIGGEFEEPLVEVVRRLRSGAGSDTNGSGTVVSMNRQAFQVPDRSKLLPLTEYASLMMPDGSDKVTGYTEATRGCKHLCRHCPVVPVYNGRFRVVQRDVVLADVAQQVLAGARHITFGDPDFFNAPAHALAVVGDLHQRFPQVSYDVTIKVEHLVKQAQRVPELAETGCVLVTTAVEAFDGPLLEILDKQHTREDLVAAVRVLKDSGIALNPTFVAFTPWTSAEVYVDFLVTLHELGLVGNVAPVQYAIRLLIPEGSRLLTLADTHDYLHGFDAEALCYKWTHPDPRMDALQRELFTLSAQAAQQGKPRHEVFRLVCETTARLVDTTERARLDGIGATVAGEAIPSLSEPWYCCAEPVESQLPFPV